MDQQFWDGRYLTQDQLWSGAPNGVLVVEAIELAPGRALDLGCGEGGDALWLAGRGWRVTAVDISRVALDRAAAAAGAADVRWTHGDVTVSPPAGGPFDLVSALYFPFPRTATDALHALLESVAPGGTLLVAGHDLDSTHHHTDQAFDPTDYYRPDEIAELLDDSWTVRVNETRPRVSPAPPGSGHIKDIVLRATR